MQLAQAMVVCGIGFATLLGCSRGSGLATYPVTGEVTMDGEVVEGATVTLVPSSEAGRSASGITDAEGKFSVMTYVSPGVQPEGAMPGDYSVTIRKLEVRKVEEGGTPQEAQAAFRKLGPPKDLLPKKYASPNTSDLKVTVNDGPTAAMSLKLTR
ncbi:carboxypeptidase-like regulatory domain-containing protein [Bremerella cremea]|uniref:carboxypeptidase-like regulatory domain-containing protein n=1 Tax=Bremerella cremea TaxID=1031537 RepID=UPI0031F19052